MPDYRASIRFMEQRGFALSGMFPITLEECMRIVEFDCVMVRSDPQG